MNLLSEGFILYPLSIMLNLSDFTPGKTYVYSSMYDKEYYYIKAIRTNKVPRKGSKHSKLGYFWFDAEIVSGVGFGSDFKHNAPGTIHSYSNSCIYDSLDELRDDMDRVKLGQIAFLVKCAKAEGIIA